MNLFSNILEKEMPGIKQRRNIENIQKLQAAKRARQRLKNWIRDYTLMLLGVLSAGFGLKGFLMPNGFIDGGVMGISLLTNAETGVSLSVLIILFNIPFLILGYRQISRLFSLKSIIAITALAIAVAAIPYPVITEDKLLVSIFGGFFLGTGIGLAIRGGCVIDGTEVLAIYLSRNNSLTVGDFILTFNIIIFSVAAYLLSIEVALYSILTYLAASRTVDFILEGIEEFTGVTIVSTHSKQITNMIQNQLGRGLTIYSGRKGFGKRGESDENINIIFTVITRLEVNRLTTEVERIDPNAFIVMQSIKDTRGGMVKKIPLKEK
ncbi:YitT family protein [Chitinophagaceae bacterium LB-8]|uniref:YitT family protein n=1 Tax=Paraflavisolibacter caeni TaxID=2982496 RepID=A0A9X3BFF4_9BACT|nr:YitT family protein [Paraflavisolibacter caeni]MCU7548709.1 YitT family protein [Paraflavisolibacter caeni]